MALFVVGVNLIEVNFREVAVEVGTKNFSARIESVTAQSVVELCITDRTVVGAEPTASFVATLIAIDLDELLT